jgi:signal transduction histidine kinase
MHPNPLQLAAMVANVLPRAVLVVSRRGEILYRNTTADEMLPPGQHPSEVLRPVPDGQTANASLDGVWNSPPPPGEWSLIRRLALQTVRGGSILADVAVYQPLEPPADAERCLVFILEDVTEQVAMERRLETAERLSTAGDAAGRLAHELANPLDGVLRLVGLAMRTVDDETQQRLQSAREGLLRMAGIVQRTAPSPDRRGGVPAEPAGALVGEAIRVNQPLADRQSVEIDLDVASPVAEIPVDAGLFQIACNLIRNALDAMPEGGRLSVDVASELGSIVLRVTDTGWGVPSDNLDDIFLPFYSTKAPGKGTGLGLAVCRDIAEGLGGEIRASRPAEGGMRFTVTVPASADTEMLAEGATL